MTDFETITVGLRSWASGDRIASAAVELLIWHKTWLLRGDLIGAGGLEDVGDGHVATQLGEVRGVRCQLTAVLNQ